MLCSSAHQTNFCKTTKSYNAHDSGYKYDSLEVENATKLPALKHGSKMNRDNRSESWDHKLVEEL